MQPDETPTNDYCHQKLTTYERAIRAAPALSHSVYRILLELIRQAAPPHWRTAATDTELGATTNTSRRAVIEARARLITLGMIDAQRGNQHQPTIYTILLASGAAASPETVAAFRGANIAPLNVTQDTQSRRANTAPLNVTEDTVRRANIVGRTKDRESRRANSAPLDTPPNKERAHAGAFEFESNEVLSLKLLTRSNSKSDAAQAIITADPATLPDDQLTATAQAIADYQANHRRFDAAGTAAALPPIDPAITAQVLTAATTVEELYEILRVMHARKLKAGSSWAWFVPTIAELGPLQIPRKLIADAWEEQRMIRRSTASQATTSQPATADQPRRKAL